MTTFIRLLETPGDEKQETLQTLVQTLQEGQPSPLLFERAPSDFAQVPGSPFAYWVGDGIWALFEHNPCLELKNKRCAAVGLQTSDDFRFVRLQWEIKSNNVSLRWFGFAKGGAYSPFYADIYLCVKWEKDGYDVKGYQRSFPRN
ncbi:MAG: hypothetical protein ACKO6N_14645, partial [Myxococcota bacterium]